VQCACMAQYSKPFRIPRLRQFLVVAERFASCRTRLQRRQDDAGGKVSILRGDSTGLCEKVHMNTRLILIGYRDIAV
jgi:hypothetical protein